MRQDILKKNITGRNPMHIVLIADDSVSMAGEPAKAATKAIHAWVNELYVRTRGKKPYFRFSLLCFGTHAGVAAEALDIRDVEMKSFALDGTSGTTNLAEALSLAAEVLERDGATADHCPPFVFLFTDGRPTNAAGKATEEAARAAIERAETLKLLDLACGSPFVVAIGFGKARDDILQQVASTPRMYHRLPSAQALVSFLPEIGTPTVEGDPDETTVGRLLEKVSTGPIREA